MRTNATPFSGTGLGTADMTELCKTSDVTVDQPFRAEVDGDAVAVFEVDGSYYVTQDLCTHGPGSLAEGYVEGDEVECPFHQGRFNIVTGEACAAPCTIALKTWQAVVDGERILLGEVRNPGGQ
jgi:nitrite reductase/ring-hydroxylating ferredoxin subunit